MEPRVAAVRLGREPSGAQESIERVQLDGHALIDILLGFDHHESLAVWRNVIVEPATHAGGIAALEQ